MTDTPTKPNLCAVKLMPEEQRNCFIEAVTASGASEDGAEFDAILRRGAKPARVP